MADFITSFDNPPIMSSSSSSGAADDNYEDACSICLEPFNTNDPATVTNCKHEYHLQCILEWSQRSKECPICWQLLVLKDPASQELLAAVENERSLRSRHNIRYAHGGYEMDREAFADDSDFDERIMRHFAAAASRACYVNKRGRHRSSGIGPSQVSFSVPTADLPDEQQMHPTSPEEWQSLSYGLLEGDSAASSTPTTIDGQYSSVVSSDVNVVPSTVGNRHGPTKPRVLCSQPPPDSPQRPSSSELLAFSDSIKSRFSAASVRYKESISRSTRGFKERLLARNVSVKELGRGVQREMSAGIAGVARMIERLDLTSKQAGASSPLSGTTMETSNISHKGKGVQESLISQSLNGNTGDTAHNMSLAAPTCICDTIPGEVEVSLAQCGK